jgi:hypothetical protein
LILRNGFIELDLSLGPLRHVPHRVRAEALSVVSVEAGSVSLVFHETLKELLLRVEGLVESFIEQSRWVAAIKVP